MAAPTESKVFGATLGGGAGAVFTSFVLWLFGVFVFGVPSDADSAGAAIGAVPLPLAGVLTAVLTLGAVYGGGWLAKHTPRPDEYVAKRVLVEGDADGAGSESPTVDAEDDVDPNELLVPEYSTV
jgi:hypothetical protein